jgi:hypothetical protein
MLPPHIVDAELKTLLARETTPTAARFKLDAISAAL